MTLSLAGKSAEVVDGTVRPRGPYQPPETVGIEFEGRLFVWHAFEPREDEITGLTEEFGPSVTVAIDDPKDAQEAPDSLQRFLSALAFYCDAAAEAISYGGDSEPDPYHPAILRAPRALPIWVMTEPYDAMGLRPEPALRLALAYYREGLNAGSPFYRFLAYWNCLDAIFGVESDSSARDEFIDEVAPKLRMILPWDERYAFPDPPAEALTRESRHAIAHVIRFEGRRSIDPDLADDRLRLDREAGLLRRLARYAIDQKYPDAVVVGDRSHER